MKEVVTDDAPESIGPYSQGIIDGDTIYVSGQGPVEADGSIPDLSVDEQTALTLENIGAVLEAAGASLDDVVKTTVFLRDMDDYDAVNERYAEYMSAPFPARSAVQVSALPVDIDVEIEAVATLVDR